MEDAQCLLDVIGDPQALNAFLEQEQSLNNREALNAHHDNVTPSTSAQPGTSIAGYQNVIKQQIKVQQPYSNINQPIVVGSPMPPPSQSPMAPSPMNHPVGSPLVAHGSPMTVVAGHQSPSPQVQQTVLHQAPSPIGNSRTNSPLLMRQPQLLPKPTINNAPIVQQQASLGQPAIQIQKAVTQSASPSPSLSLQVPIQPGLTNKVHNASNTLHYQPQATTSVISTIQNSTPINLQGSTILQTSTGKYLLPSGLQLQNLQHLITSPSAPGQQVLVQNQIVQNTPQTGISASNANLLGYSQQPSQIVIQGAAGGQQGNIILRTVPSVLQTTSQNSGAPVQNGQKTILIAPHQNLGQFQTTTGAVTLNQPANMNLLPKSLPAENGNVIVNVGGQNINLQQLKNLQAVNVAGSNMTQLANSAKIQTSNLNVQLSQANVIVNNIPQATTVQSQLVSNTANQAPNAGGQVYLNHISQSPKTTLSVTNPVTSTSQLVSNVIAAQSKILAKAASKKHSGIQIQRAGDTNRRSPGGKSGTRAQVSTNQAVPSSLSAAQAQADNILSQAISICNLEFMSSKSSSLVTNSVSKTNLVNSQNGSVPTPVTRQTLPPSIAVNVSNVTLSRVAPPLSSTPVSFSQSSNSSMSNAVSIHNVQNSSVNAVPPNSAVRGTLSSSANLSSSLSQSNSPVPTTITNASQSTVQPAVSQLGMKVAVSQTLDVKPVASPLTSGVVVTRPAEAKNVAMQLNVQPNPVQSAPINVCAQPCVSLSTAITTVAASQATQCPTISSSTSVPILSVQPTSENNNATQMQTVHLSQQAQLALQKVQHQMKLLLAKKDRRPEEDVHLQKLIEVQRKIIAHGQEVALKKQQQLQQQQQNKQPGNPAVSPVTQANRLPVSVPVSQHIVTDAKSAIVGIKNMHKEPAPNVTISKSGPTPIVMETKVNKIPAGVQALSHGSAEAKVQNGANVISNTQSGPRPVQVKVANHSITLNLTPEQQTRFEEQLKKLTPEQQEAFYKQHVGPSQKLQILLKQQVQAKNVVQIKHEQNVGQNTVATAPGTVAVTVQQVAPGINQIKPIIATSPVTATFTTDRGIKRISTGAISRTSLLHQQLLKDQAAVLTPNCRDPFKNANEACRRLLRYHVFHEKEPPSYIRQKEEENFEEYARDVLEKRQKMLSWYQMLLIEESMRPEPTSELVMMERMFLDQERQQLAADRQKCKEDPANFIPTPITSHTELELVEIPPATTTGASAAYPTSTSSGVWTSTASQGRVNTELADSSSLRNLDIPKSDDLLPTDVNIPCESDKPKLGVKLIIKRNYKDLSGADTYVAASRNPRSTSPKMPKDYEDFRTNVSGSSMNSEPSDIEIESIPLRSSSQMENEQENSCGSGGYVCTAGYMEDMDSEERNEPGVSGNDTTVTEDELSQSEDVIAVDSLLHSDLDIKEENGISDDDEPVEISDFFQGAPDQELENERAMLCSELDVLNGLDNSFDAVSPFGDDSPSPFSIDMPEQTCQSKNAIEGPLINVPSNRLTDPLGLEDQDFTDPLGLDDPNENGATNEETVVSDMEVEQTKPSEDFESALSSIESSTSMDISRPEAPVSVDSGLQSGGLDNSVEPVEPLESLDYLSDISDVEEENLGEQMQNAIDSILSLQQFQDNSFAWPTTFASMGITPGVSQDSFEGQMLDQGTDNEDDLDMAIQSIL